MSHKFSFILTPKDDHESMKTQWPVALAHCGAVTSLARALDVLRGPLFTPANADPQLGCYPVLNQPRILLNSLVVSGQWSTTGRYFGGGGGPIGDGPVRRGLLTSSRAGERGGTPSNAPPNSRSSMMSRTRKPGGFCHYIGIAKRTQRWPRTELRNRANAGRGQNCETNPTRAEDRIAKRTQRGPRANCETNPTGGGPGTEVGRAL